MQVVEAKKWKHVRIVTPDWLWSCAERWEHVEELLYPLSGEMTVVHRKPPAHCTSPDVALQLVMAGSSLEESKATAPVSDRSADKKRTDKGKTLASPRLTVSPITKRVYNRTHIVSNRIMYIVSKFQLFLNNWKIFFVFLFVQAERPSRRFSETLNPLLAFSTQDIADMDREVEDIMQDGGGDGDFEGSCEEEYENEEEDSDSDTGNEGSSAEDNNESDECADRDNLQGPKTTTSDGGKLNIYFIPVAL